MIRINLLPVREITQRLQARRQCLLVLLAAVGVLVILLGVWQWQGRQALELRTEISRLEGEKNRFAGIIKKMKDIEEKRAILAKRIEVIEQLKKNTSLAVHLLDEVARLTPGDRVWLESLKQNDASVQLRGVALDNQTVAQYMENLKGSEYFQSVELADSSLKQVEGHSLKAFALDCNVKVP